MSKRIIISALMALIIGWIGIVIGTTYYVKSLVVHPDAIATTFNPTTNKKVQMYGIGDMNLYIEETYRVKMASFASFVKINGLTYDKDFNAIQDSLGEEYSMLAKGEDNNLNPFIVKLKIGNTSDEPIEILAKNIRLKNAQNEELVPHEEWQELMSKAGMFSGAGNQTILPAHESTTLWLVYSTPTVKNQTEGIHQEYLKLYLGSDSDSFATKVEIPFNFTMGYPIGDYETITNEGYRMGVYAIILWTILVLLVSWRASKY